MKILITGSKGFVGQNICAELRNRGIPYYEYDVGCSDSNLELYLRDSSSIIHLAGTNRPQKTEEYYSGNSDLTLKLVQLINKLQIKLPIIFSSSIQATMDGDYGKSKKIAEDILFEYSSMNRIPVYIYRLSNLFGKWCRPNYNSVVATFCYNVANDMPISISNPDIVIPFVYIDDVVENLLESAIGKTNFEFGRHYFVEPIYQVSIGSLLVKIKNFALCRSENVVPNLENDFDRKLYATFLSYINGDKLSSSLVPHEDNRGSFTEILKSSSFGQISVNVIKPGIIKGNHWHHTKNEKFVLLDGQAKVKLRQINSNVIFTYDMSVKSLQIIDIPPGYTHSIENDGLTDSILLIWASEIFDISKPDTYYMEVGKNE